jgi:uncharacterized protein involved in exopolysaccharide biosynthesis
LWQVDKQTAPQDEPNGAARNRRRETIPQEKYIMDRRTDQHRHEVEEQIHREHAQRREQARAGDGTIEQGEQELARIRAAKHRNEIAALKAQNDDLRRQLAEVR